MRRVLLLGGTGFIGSRVLETLRALEGVRIMMLAHRRVPYRCLEDVDLVVESLTRFDLSWIERFEPDTIIHAARLGGAGRWRRFIASRRGYRANRRLVDWLAGYAPSVRVIYVSGTLVYGEGGETEIDEATSLKPIAFAREYLHAERPWMEAQRIGALPVTIVRPPWVVGPGSWLQGWYVRPAARTGRVPVYGDGRNWMTFLDVEDCAGTIVHLALEPETPATVNLLAPGQRVRQEDFVEHLAAVLGAGIESVELSSRRGFGDRALAEALTSSLRVSTLHGGVLDGYAWKAAEWHDMIARHVSAS